MWPWHKVPGQAPHITADYSADIRNRTPRAKINLHIQKPQPQVSIKNKTEKIHKLFDVYNTMNKRYGKAVAMAMLPLPPTKLITLPLQCGFAGAGKKEEYAKPHVLNGEERVTGISGLRLWL